MRALASLGPAWAYYAIYNIFIKWKTMSQEFTIKCNRCPTVKRLCDFLSNKTSCPAPKNPNKYRSYQVTWGEIWLLSANAFHRDVSSYRKDQLWVLQIFKIFHSVLGLIDILLHKYQIAWDFASSRVPCAFSSLPPVNVLILTFKFIEILRIVISCCKKRLDDKLNLRFHRYVIFIRSFFLILS